MALKRENLGVKTVAHIVMILASLMAVIPFLMLFSSSVTSTEAIAQHGYGIFPTEISFEAYEYLLQGWTTIGKAYLVTIEVTVIGTFLHLFVTTMFAFGLAWRRTPCKGLIMILLIVTMLFNGGAVATYIVYANVLHVSNTIWGLILPGMLMNAFGVILFMNYFKNTVSLEYMEAAEIDGANMFMIYYRIYIPLSVPIIVTLGISTAIGYWNDWNNSLYYISADRQDLYSIQRLLREMQESLKFIASNPQLGMSTEDIPSSTVQMAVAVLGILPIIIAYPFFQRFFIAGISLGGVKG